MTDDTPPQQTEEADSLSGPCSNSLNNDLGWSLVGTQWSAMPIDAPLAPVQVPSEKTTQHLEPMAPGRLEPDASTFHVQFHCHGDPQGQYTY